MDNKIREILDDFRNDVENNLYIEVRGIYYKPLLDYINNLQQEKEDYKSRCEKASEYINCNKQKTICAYGDNEDDDFEICLWEEDIDNLLNILQNGSDTSE